MKISEKTTVKELRELISGSAFIIRDHKISEGTVYSFRMSDDALVKVTVIYLNNQTEDWGNCEHVYFDRPSAVAAFNKHLMSMRLEE